MKRAQKKSNSPPTYAKACRNMGLMDYWTVEDAAALILGEIPPGQSGRKSPVAKAKKIARLAHILSGADCVVNPETTSGRFRVPPVEIIEWIQRRNGSAVPQELKVAVLGAVEEIQKQEAFTKKSTLRRERCRAIAELLWKQEENKHLTLEAMAKHPVLLQIGCQGTRYEHETIKDWIKEQNPNRNPGRRPKSK